MTTESAPLDGLNNVNADTIVAWLQTEGVAFAVDLVAALVILIVGRIAVGFIVRGARIAMRRNNVESTLESFVSTLIRWGLMIVVIIAAIAQVGIETTSFIAIFGAAGLAIGLALQGSLSNFAAGVLIVLFRPYRTGDWIEAAGISGSVEQVQMLTTTLTTGDNKQVIVPNSQIMDSVITNYSAKQTRRVDLVIGVSYDDDIDKVRKTLEDIIARDERILSDPAPTIAVSELADSSVNFVVRPWTSTSDYWGVRFGLMEAIKKRFDEEDITFPFPQQDVHLIRDTAD